MEIKPFNTLVKNLKKEKRGVLSAKVAILGDSSTQLLSKAIRAYGVEQSIDIVLYESAFNQIDLHLLDRESIIYQEDYDFIIIYKSVINLRKQYYKLPIESKLDFANTIFKKLENYLVHLNKYSKAKVLFFNFEEGKDPIFSNFANKVRHSWLFTIRTLNYKLMELATRNTNLFICDKAAISNRLGLNKSFDAKIYARTGMVDSLESIPFLAKSVIDIIAANLGKINKCLILDLDNTLWGGVIGDDGMENIHIGKLGLGSIFTELQLWAKTLKERGILLAICSKNTEEIAKEPFEKHPDMELRLDDISVFVANWNNKADNIRYIQSILNIGFDSMVFIDDNPFERNLVRSELPEVSVPELPEDPAEYLSYLQQFNLFETAVFDKADETRTQKYKEEQLRRDVQSDYTSIENYLADLEMEGQIKIFDSFNLPRITQLVQRSNQFNFRTIRYTQKELEEIMVSPEHIPLYITLKDKFGDYGLISILILTKMKPQTFFIDTWIMSCRVLNRGVEKFVMNYVVTRLQKEQCEVLIGEILPTRKNVIIKNHYKNFGFQQKNEKWFLQLETYQAVKHSIKFSD